MNKLVRYCGLAALLAGAALYFSDCGDNGTGPAPYYGPWEVVACPEGPSYLNGVFFLNPDLGYAVGCEYVLKYEGGKWATDYICKGTALEDVWFCARDDGWVCGWGEGTGVLLRYDGRRWKRFEHNTAATSFYALHFTNANDGWAAGFGICHWNGEKWEYVSDLKYLTDIYANSPTDVWAVSKYNERIYHYDGASWTLVHDDAWGIELYSIWFTSSDHGWAAGDGCISGTQSNLLEYKNGRWQYYLGEPWREGIRRSIYALHFSDPNNGWAVGQYTFRWDGERWWYVKIPPGVKTHVAMLMDVYTISDTDAWAVGQARCTLHYQP